MSDITLWAYRESLSDLTPGELDYGCREAIRYTKFTPTPAEILEHALAFRESVAPSKPALNAVPSDPPMTDAEAKEFIQMVRSKIPWLNKA